MCHERHPRQDALLPPFHVRTLLVNTSPYHWSAYRQRAAQNTRCNNIPNMPAQIKNPQGLTETLRIAPGSSSSPVPQPSRERWSIHWAGLLAHGSSYSPRLPIHLVDSGNTGFRPHSQRRDREGFTPSSLTQESYLWRHNRRPC